MAGWETWIGKKVFLRLKTGKVYSGNVVEVNDAGNGLIFFMIKDKFGMNVMFSTGEIIELKEEEDYHGERR